MQNSQTHRSTCVVFTQQGGFRRTIISGDSYHKSQSESLNKY